MGVAYGYGGVTVLLLHHELCHWLANDVGASENDALLSASRDVIALQKGHDAEWGSRDEAGQSDCHAAHIDGVEAVNILAVVDGLDNLLLVNMLRQWQLNNEAVDVGVVVELIDTFEKLSLGDVVLIANEG